jgi:hypothetical protein
VSTRANSWSSSMVLHLPAAPWSGEASFRPACRSVQKPQKPRAFPPQNRT